jgi:hypothetical protein
MCPRFAFLLITRVASWLRLSRREEAWQTAEILLLRHQLAAELVSDSLVYRYNVGASPDGLAGAEATFSICSF